MKRPRQGIWSTRHGNAISSPNAGLPPLQTIIENSVEQDDFNYELDQQHIINMGANIITDKESPTDANLFFFAVFADKHTGTVYNDLTGSFPFMSLEGNVCFFVVFHYKTNAILELPISGFSNEVLFDAYKQQYKLLESKGFTIKLNVMDNQGSTIIKKYLTMKQFDQKFVKPHNHRVNTAKGAIWTFKVHFISALAATNSKFLLQL
jgi:hypothetical protein